MISCESSNGISLVFILGLQPRDMLVINTINNFFYGFYMKMELHVHSQRREALLFLITNMAVGRSSANRQCNKIIYQYLRGCVAQTSISRPTKILPEVGRNEWIVYKVCFCKRTCILLLRIDSNSSLDMRGTWVTRSISSLPTLLSPGTFPA